VTTRFTVTAAVMACQGKRFTIESYLVSSRETSVVADYPIY